MKKKIFFSVVVLLAMFLASTYTLAADDNKTGMQKAADSVKNAVGGAENTVENAARGISNTSKNVTSDMQNAGNNIGNSVSNTMNNMTGNSDSMNNTSGNTDENNNTAGFMGTNGTNSDNYSAERTATTAGTSDNTFLGMDSTTWVWIIMALAAIDIGILIYSYFNQANANYEHSDE